MNPIRTEATYHFTCPNCDSDRKFSITHLAEMASESAVAGKGYTVTFGAWGCKKCNHQIRGKITATLSAREPYLLELTSEPGKLQETAALVLLRSNTGSDTDSAIYLVIPATVADNAEEESKEVERLRYLYDEHLCPTAIVKYTLAVGHYGSDDPHGAFEFQRHVKIRDVLPEFPQDYDFHNIGLTEELQEMLPQLFPEAFGE